MKPLIACSPPQASPHPPDSPTYPRYQFAETDSWTEIRARMLESCEKRNLVYLDTLGDPISWLKAMKSAHYKAELWRFVVSMQLLADFVEWAGETWVSPSEKGPSGYTLASVPVFRQDLVDQYNWLSDKYPVRVAHCYRTCLLFGGKVEMHVSMYWKYRQFQLYHY